MGKQYGMKLFETCAKDNTNIDQAFKFLLNKIISNPDLKDKIAVDNITGQIKGKGIALTDRIRNKDKQNNNCCA